MATPLTTRQFSIQDVDLGKFVDLMKNKECAARLGYHPVENTIAAANGLLSDLHKLNRPRGDSGPYAAGPSGLWGVFDQMNNLVGAVMMRTDPGCTTSVSEIAAPTHRYRRIKPVPDIIKELSHRYNVEKLVLTTYIPGDRSAMYAEAELELASSGFKLSTIDHGLPGRVYIYKPSQDSAPSISSPGRLNFAPPPEKQFSQAFTDWSKAKFPMYA